MAQMTRELAQSILDGQGITSGEIMQLCHHYLAAHPPTQTAAVPDGWTVTKNNDDRITVMHPEAPRTMLSVYGNCEDIVEIIFFRFLDDMLSASPAPVEKATPDELTQRALSLYRPPFNFMHGYIFDGDHNTVADSGDMDELKNMIIARVRGWGRISYMDEPEKLQDKVGELVAQALTEFWERIAPAPGDGDKENG